MPDDKERTSRFALKAKGGIEINHQRHPKNGVPWCELCIKENRKEKVTNGFLAYIGL